VTDDEPNIAASTPIRLDAALFQRGLSRSRSHAAQLLKAGAVLVNNEVERKASRLVGDRDELAVTSDEQWVSRAALKLVAALDAFGIDPAGRVALDVGASTGGFSQVLVSRDAATVLAIDVGHNQLATVLRSEPRIRLAEGINARELTQQELIDLFGAVAGEISLVVVDVSFISLRQVLPALVQSAPQAEFVVLIKPQFEVGRGGIRDGVVVDDAKREAAIEAVLTAAGDLGLAVIALEASPITGEAGNHEVLAHLRPSVGASPAE